MEKTLDELLHAKREKISQQHAYVGGGKSNPPRRKKHVHSLEVVCRKSLYGMFVDPHVFIKATLRDPGDCSRLAAILEDVPLGGITMQTYESHIPYLLQFTSDFNIRPMGWMHLTKDVKFRAPLPPDIPLFPPPELNKTTADSPEEPADEDTTTTTTIRLTPDSVDKKTNQSYSESPCGRPPPPAAASPSATQMFMTARSPLKRVALGRARDDAQTATSVDSQHVGSSAEIRSNKGMYTQSTVPAANLWVSQLHLHQQEFSPPPVDCHVEALSEDIPQATTIANPTDTNAQAVETKLCKPVLPLNDEHYSLQGIEKESCCELELDAHCSHIENARMARTTFGAELWEEERIRCESKGLVMEGPPAPPSTQTVHRDKQQNELNFVQRYHNLAAKGRALQQIGTELLEAGDDDEAHPHRGSSLSQFLLPSPAKSPGGDGKAEDCLSTARRAVDSWDDDRTVDVSPGVGNNLGIRETPSPFGRRMRRVNSGSSQLSEATLQQWVARQIDDVNQTATLDAQLAERLFSGDSQQQVEEFLLSQQQGAVGGAISDPPQNRSSRGIAEEQEGEEEGEGELSAQQEADDIICSTQQQQCEEEEEEAKATVEGVDQQQQMDDIRTEEVGQRGSSLVDEALVELATRLNPVFSSGRPPLIPRPAVSRVTLQYESPQSPDPTFFSRSRHNDSSSSAVSSSGVASALSRKRKIDARRVEDGSPASSLYLDRTTTLDSPPSHSSRPSVRFADTSPPPHSLVSALATSSSGKKRLRRTVSFKDVLDGLDRFVSSAAAASPPQVVLSQQPSAHQPTAESPSLASECVAVELFSADEVGVDVQKPSTVVCFNQKEQLTISIHSAVDCLSPACLVPTFAPPLLRDLPPLHTFGLLDVLHTPAFFSVEEDAKVVGASSSAAVLIHSRHPVKWGGDLLPFDGGHPTAEGPLSRPEAGIPFGAKCLVPTFLPPKPADLWRDLKGGALVVGRSSARVDKSQICTPTQTPHSPHCGENDANVGAGATTNRLSRLTVLSCEVHCNTRSGLLPNPQLDAVQAVCWVVDDLVTTTENEGARRLHGVVCVVGGFQDELGDKKTSGEAVSVEEELNARMTQQLLMLGSYGLPRDAYLLVVDSEAELLLAMANTVSNVDPDFLVGYELQSGSLGYLVRRGKVLGVDMTQLLSRMQGERPSYRNEAGGGGGGVDGHESGLFVTGRNVLNMWQRMRDEVKLFSYTYSNVCTHLLGKRVPFFSTSQLTRWYRQSSSRGRVLRHVLRLAELNLTLMANVDLVRKTSESARLYGIDFFSVLSRGSQYRVEASLLTKAHALGFVLLSPSRRLVASQAPMECVPLVMEPRSRFYHDPVVVLDFQSLYPSMMLAHNLCFSTCFGKLKPGVTGETETTECLGTTSYPELQSASIANLHSEEENFNESGTATDDSPYVSPNGSVFCAKSVRKGILPLMVQEMLDTRVMVKRAMKRHRLGGSHVLQKVLNARQLAIKLLSNVTYGYTAAGFSGRMPMAELADAIVQSGRSLLEWTAHHINGQPDWRAKVVYGDTDSVFIELAGRTRDEAFRLGQEIADTITAKCPADVVLKFEKVYLPSILVTKKRYVGYSFESPSQRVAHLDAKGIEVVRRDQCLATTKMQEKCLRVLFETKDLSQVKSYLYAQWAKMLQGGDSLLMRDFVFAKEVRFGHYASASSQPPGAVVSTKAVLADEMAVPPYNWRVPYVVVTGVPNAPLKHLVYAPEEVLRRGSALRLNYTYYIGKCINPALDRVLSLCGADVFAWFQAMPRPKIRLRHINYDALLAEMAAGTSEAARARSRQTLMDRFTAQASCTVCGADAQPQKALCTVCSESGMDSLVLLMRGLNAATQREHAMSLVCQNCSKSPQACSVYCKGDIVGPDCCESLDCELFFERGKLVTRIEDFQIAVSEIEDLAFS